jgi:hypothetical protein
MTTVIDPGTSGESVFFNKSGTAILNITLDAGGSETVDAVAGTVFVIGTCPSPDSSNPQTLTFSPDFQPGDEFWFIPRTHFWNIVDENGNHLISNPTGTVGFIKVSTSSTTLPNWVALVGA